MHAFFGAQPATDKCGPDNHVANQLIGPLESIVKKIPHDHAEKKKQGREQESEPHKGLF
jgi:hypothetical protein